MNAGYLIGWAITFVCALVAGACFMHWYMTRDQP